MMWSLYSIYLQKKIRSRNSKKEVSDSNNHNNLGHAGILSVEYGDIDVANRR